MSVRASFPLIVEQSNVPDSNNATSNATSRSFDLNTMGLLRPFRRDLKSDFAAGRGEALIRSAIGQVLGTVGGGEQGGGELPWRPEFGSSLHRLRHMKNDVLLKELARVYVVDALKRWEPRVRVVSVTITRENQEGSDVLAIRLKFAMVSQENTQNDPLEEVVLVGA